MNRRFTIDPARIVHEALEDEVVVVNLDSGSYYMLEGTAPAIWGLLAGGVSVDETVRELAGRHPADEGAIAGAVNEFVDQLMQEGLLIEAPGEPGDPRPPRTEAPVLASPVAFTPPVMYRYTDMQTLIQMDPIRDFDETGWPRRRTPPAR
jgi:coenzyme PQQ synthesis protein D (PqqD)